MRKSRGPVNKSSSRTRSGIQAGNAKRGVTVDTALRLARLFGTTPQYWLNLQRDYDLAIAVATSTDSIHRIEPLQTASEARVRWWPTKRNEE
ncbi:MAG TPA: HigA family addiction module antitoxin [Rhodothermales bacterium]|nr:HigA family addiction module antitoxin [Rhodothermales bacterium]